MCKNSNAPREHLVYKKQNALAPLLADVVVELMEKYVIITSLSAFIEKRYAENGRYIRR